MANIIEARVKQKKDTLPNWEANPMILLDGEQAFVVNGSGQPINFKIGDGTKRFSELPFWIQYDQAAYIPVSGLALPTPSQPVGYSILGEGTYTHSSGGFTVPAGHWGVANWGGSAWSFSDRGIIPVNLPEGEVKIGDVKAPNGDKVALSFINKGVDDMGNGYSVKSIKRSQYTKTGKAVRHGTGEEMDVPTMSTTDVIELPEDWESIDYYRADSDFYGIAFYASDRSSIPLTLGGLKNAYNEIKKTDFPDLKKAKYVKNTIFTDNVLYNYKNRLNIKSKTDVIGTYPKVLKRNRYDIWKLKEENSNRIVVEYSFESLHLNVASNVKRSELIDIQGWGEIYILLPQTNNHTINLYNDSLVKEFSINGDTDISTVYSKISSVDYPNVSYIELVGLESTKSDFIFSVSLPKYNKPVNSETKKNSLLKLGGIEVSYIDFNNDFSLVGAYRIEDGVLNTTLVQHKSTEPKMLPSDWDYIEYDNFLSGFYGLVLWDEDKRFIKGIPNLSSSSYRKVRVYRKDVITARFFGFSWSSTFKELDFKIVRKRSKYADYLNKDFERTVSRLSNPEITSFEEFNSNNPNSQIDKFKVFTNTDVAGKPYARIPTTILTNAGTILCATEFRAIESQGDDRGEFDLVLKRKVGSGEFTSQNLFPFSSVYGRAMNPCFLIDRSGLGGMLGRIYLFVATIKDPNKLAGDSTTAELDTLYRYSDDDGVTWSGINSIKNKWDTSKYTASLVSPANGIQLTNGTFVLPCMIVKSKAWRSGVCYKTPTGEWTFSDATPRFNDNESTVVEIETNKILLNCRYDGSPVDKRRSAYIFDINSGLFSLHDSDKTFEPYHGCQGSIEKINIGSQKMFLFSYPDKSDVLNPNPINSRFNLTVWASFDCKKWIRVYVAHFPIGLGYSVLSFHNNQLIMCYEVGQNLEVELQILTPLLSKINRDVNVNLKLTAEEKLNRMIYSSKGWAY